MKANQNQPSRRKFIMESAIVGAGLMLACPVQLLSKDIHQKLWRIILNQKDMLEKTFRES